MNQDQKAKLPVSTTGQNPEMQDAGKNRDRAVAESEARRAQPRPARSGELNPGAAEYREQLPDGPAGTGGAIDSGVPQPEK